MRTQKLSGHTRKVVVKKEEYMYIPLLETLQNLLNGATVYEEVYVAHHFTENVYTLYILHCFNNRL